MEEVKDMEEEKTHEFKLGKQKSLVATIEIASPGTEVLLLGGGMVGKTWILNFRLWKIMKVKGVVLGQTLRSLC